MTKKSKHTDKETDLEKDAVETASEQSQTAEETPAEETSAEEPQAQSTEATEAAAVENEDFKDQYLRLRADFENFRKRTRKEKEEWTQRSLDRLTMDLLKVLDSFDLGIENSKGKEFTEDTLKGFELVRGQLSSTLGSYGLQEVAVGEGGFDPNLHEAIVHMPSAEVPEGQIVAVTRKGYQMGTRLLRPTQVVVSAGAPEAVTSEVEGEG
jgi:molecular chaperone GrpE